MLAAASAGAAVAVAGALRGAAGRPVREAYVFAISTGGAVGVAAGLVLAGGPAAAVALALLGAAAAVALVRLVDGRRRIANLGVFLVLFPLLLAATPAYMAAMTQIDGFGGAAIWLLGDVSRAHGIGAVLVALAALALIALAGLGPERFRAAASALLLGLSVGVAGPIAFVGSMIPALVRTAARGVSLQGLVALSALAGAAAVMLADAVPRWLIGGYAPPLNVAIGNVALPAFLWWNGRRLRAASGAGASRAFTAVGVTGIVALSLGLVLFFRLLTIYVRAAT
jgi:iron complex transport system permease protein